MQIQKDLSFYNNILGKFTTKDIVSLRLNSKGDTIQESNTEMITADVVMTANITVDAVILNDAGVANDMLRMAQ